MRALITGITGMDGSHLAEELAEAGHEVWGMIRDPDAPHRNTPLTFWRPVVADLLDERSLREAVNAAAPEVVYHLAAMSSPSQAWAMPTLCGEVTGLGTERLLRAVADTWGGEVRVMVAGSIAGHGPYGAAKRYAATVAADYRERGYPITTMLMGGHHSPRRGNSYLSQKVAQHAGTTAAWLKRGAAPSTQPKLHLGWLGRVQDWGWAPDFMRVWARLHELPPSEYTLSTGTPVGVGAWIARCYAYAGLTAADWVVSNPDSGPQPHDVPKLTARTDPRLVHLLDGLDSFQAPQTFMDEVMIPAMVGSWIARGLVDG